MGAFCQKSKHAHCSNSSQELIYKQLYRLTQTHQCPQRYFYSITTENPESEPQ